MELKMKKMLLFIAIFATIISLFFVFEIIMIRQDIPMPHTMRYVFGVLFILLSLSIIIYLMGSKIFKYHLPDFISMNIIEIIALAMVVFIMSIILLIKK
jgi:hypothetical protein